MLLTPDQKKKSDPLLQEILSSSDGNDVLQVVMVLAEDSVNNSIETIQPSQFNSRVEYRQALIEQRKKQLQQGNVGKTIAELKKLSLQIQGGEASRFVVVEGTAEEIAKSLQLSGIKSASFDQIVRVEPPEIKEEWVNYLSELFFSILGKNREQIQAFTRQYISEYYRQYGRLQVLGMRQPIKLEDIYTTVKVLPQSLARQFRDAEGIEKVLRNKQVFYKEKEDKISGIEVANQYCYLTVLGQPGSGKSTLLRKIGLDAIKGTLELYRIPIFIELKRFRTPEDIDLLRIISESFHRCACPQTEELITAGLKQGKFIILLDGLDEVPAKIVTQVVSKTKQFIRKVNSKGKLFRPYNRFIISCRTAAYNQSFRKFNGVIISDFDQLQIEQFIRNWFSSDVDTRAETASKCLAKLAENEGAKDLAKTPLLLTFICLVYDKSQTLPKNISELYKKALEILLEEWSAEKRLPRDPIYQDFTTQSEIMLLSQIAYEGFIQDKLLFTTEELVTKIKAFLARNLNAPQNLDGKAVLNAIVVQQGILTERLDNIYSFSHLTLQEYLTAKYIVDNDLITKTIEKYTTDTKWKEVFILIAGLMEGQTGADQLILSLEKQALAYLKYLQNKRFFWHKHRFLRLLEWAERKTDNSPASFSTTTKRVIAIVIATANANAYSEAILKVNAQVKNAFIFYNFNLNNFADNFIKTHTKPQIDISKAYVFEYVNAIAYANTPAITNAIENFLRKIDEMLEFAPLFVDVNLEELKNKLQALEKKTPSRDQSYEVYQKFAQQLIKTWLNAFGLTIDMINLSKEELDEIDDRYFYVYNLILQCKDSAVLVTESTWRDVEERMYRVPT